MSSYFYIKLFHEILHDPKMGRLTDNLWRRVIEVFLLAGENGRDGYLPAVEDMAWELRLSVEELEANLQALSKYNIVSLTDNGWHVTHFEKRQAPIEGKERVSAHRDRAKKQAYYATETDETQESNADVTSRYTELDIDIEKSNSKSKAKAATPPQVETYRKAAHKFPNKSLWKTICETVPDTPESLELFERVILGWIAKGWNPSNIAGQLECYKRGEIPGQNGNGTPKQPEQPAPRKVYR